MDRLERAAPDRGGQAHRHDREPLAFGVVERLRAHDGGARLPSRPTPSRTVSERPSTASSADSQARPIARLSVGLHLALVTRPIGAPWRMIAAPSVGHPALDDLEAGQHLARAACRDRRRRVAADEVRLLGLDHPAHARLERARERVRVLADDRVLLLEPQDALRLDAERPGARAGARRPSARPRGAAP